MFIVLFNDYFIIPVFVFVVIVFFIVAIVDEYCLIKFNYLRSLCY